MDEVPEGGDSSDRLGDGEGDRCSLGEWLEDGEDDETEGVGAVEAAELVADDSWVDGAL